MAERQRIYDREYKIQAVKLSKEIGGAGDPGEHAVRLSKSGAQGAAGHGSRRSYAGEREEPDGGGDGTAETDQGSGESQPAPGRGKRIFGGGQCFFCRESSEVGKSERMRFLAKKVEDGAGKGKMSQYCRRLGVSRQGFYQYLANRDRPWKYQGLADAMREIVSEDPCNDTYGRVRMRQALELKALEGVKIPSERTVYRVMEQVGLSHHPRRKPNGITKADREVKKSDDLLKQDFQAEKPLEKCVTDITEIKAKDGKLYVSAIFDCFDLTVLGLAMADNMRAELCAHPGRRSQNLSGVAGCHCPR